MPGSTGMRIPGCCSRKIYYDLYQSAVKSYILAYKNTHKDIYLEKAFEISEKSKAAVLLSALKDENAFNIGLVPDSLYQLEKNLRANLYLYKIKIDEEEGKIEPSSSRLNYMRAGLFADEKRYDSLLNLYERNYPEYFKLKYDPGVISVKELRKILADEDILIEYMLTSHDLYTFVVSKKEMTFIETPIDTQLVNHIFALRENLYPPNAANYNYNNYLDYQNRAYALYLKLIHPIKDYIEGKNIILIPDGELAYLSFESLIDTSLNSKTINFKDLPYLLHKYTFNYASSATIFSMCQTVKKPRMKKGLLAMAPSYPLVKKSVLQEYGDFGGVLQANRDLPGALWEVDAVLKFIPGEKLSGQEATEGRFKEMAGKFDILHFAMHTYINDEDPRRPCFHSTRLVKRQRMMCSIFSRFMECG